jgi:hypothetical protein
MVIDRFDAQTISPDCSTENRGLTGRNMANKGDRLFGKLHAAIIGCRSVISASNANTSSLDNT